MMYIRTMNKRLLFRITNYITNYITIYYSYTVRFFLTVAVGSCMVKLVPPVNFCSDENIQTIFGSKLEDFLNYRISCEKNNFLRPGIIVRRAAARIASLSAQLNQHLTISTFDFCHFHLKNK
jgi:hypothetical protein